MSYAAESIEDIAKTFDYFASFTEEQAKRVSRTSRSARTLFAESRTWKDAAQFLRSTTIVTAEDIAKMRGPE